MSLVDIAERIKPRLPALDDDDLRHLYCKWCHPGPYPTSATSVCGSNGIMLGLPVSTAMANGCVVCLDLLRYGCPTCRVG